MLDLKHEIAQKELRKRERERRKLELGDDFDSEIEGHSNHSSNSEDEDFSDSYDSEYNDENVSSNQERMLTPPSFMESDNSVSRGSIDKLRIKSKKEAKNGSAIHKGSKEMTPIAEEVTEEFNAVRFLGLALKEMVKKKRSE